jgi:predicted DCC family thiol-disulfide oxidoreductase YuxK
MGTTVKIGGAERLGATAAAVTHVVRPVLLYSGGCRFCRWAARTIARLDRGQQLAFLPLADLEAGRLLDAVPENRRTESWWIVRRDGMPVSGEKGGGIVLLTEIRPTRLLGRALGAIGLSPLIDALDRFVARHRGRLSRFVPDGPAPLRYP